MTKPGQARTPLPVAHAIVPVSTAAAAVYVLTKAFNIDTIYALYSGRQVALAGPPHLEALTTAGSHTWIDQQWLGQWWFFEIYRIGGYAGLVFACILLMIGSGVLLARLMSRHDGCAPTAWAAMAVLAFGSCTALDRTQALAYPLFISLLCVLSLMLRRRSWHPSTLLAIPILLIWANVHGSVLLGAGLAFASLSWHGVSLLRLGRRAQAAAAMGVALASLCTVVATPYGLSTIRYYSSLLGSSALRTYVSDWHAPSLSNPNVWPFIALCILAVPALAIGIRQHRKRMLWVEVSAAIAFTGLALWSARYLVWASVAVAYVASVHGAKLLPRLPRPLVVSARIAATALSIVGAAVLITTPASLFTDAFPVHLASAAAAEVKIAPNAVLLADQTTSAALLWLQPVTAGHVAFDIRYEQYRADDLLAYFRFLHGHSRALACSYGAIAISRADWPRLVSAFRADPAWTATYDGKDGIVAIRTPGTTCR